MLDKKSKVTSKMGQTIKIQGCRRRRGRGSIQHSQDRIVAVRVLFKDTVEQVGQLDQRSGYLRLIGARSHRICSLRSIFARIIIVMMRPSVLRDVETHAPKVGQSRCLCPSVNTLTLSVPNMNNYYHGRGSQLKNFDPQVASAVGFFHHQIRISVAVLIDLEGNCVNCVLAIFIRSKCRSSGKVGSISKVDEGSEGGIGAAGITAV